MRIRVDLFVVPGIQLGLLVGDELRKFGLRVVGVRPSQSSVLDGEAVVVWLVGAGSCWA